MTARFLRACILAAGLLVAFVPVGVAGAEGGDGLRPGTREPFRTGVPDSRLRPREPAAESFLIYLLDGSDPIVVNRFVRDGDQIIFQKYGGWVRIPTYEVLKIVRDEPDRDGNLPSPPRVPGPDRARPPFVPEANLYLTMHGGGNLKVSALMPEGDRVRVAVPNGSFTVPRSEILGVVRVPSAGEVPEAWLSIEAGHDASEAGHPRSAGLVPTPPEPRLPYSQSDRPHVVRLGNGRLIRVEAFWVEDGELRFRRLGGVVGVALGEVLRILPDETAPVQGRTPVRFARRLGPDLLEVTVRSGYHRVRLTGLAAREPDGRPDGPWGQLERGAVVYLEFDRQRYDAEGNWLAYVFLPNGRMLNAELIRAGLAEPASDGGNVRYLDLLHELADGHAVNAGGQSD